MSDLESGMLVTHVSLGLGKVIAIEPSAVHVFFARSDGRVATKLRLPMAAPLLRPAPAGDGAWLSAMPAFSRDAESGRYKLADTWLSHDDAVARFREAFPEAFADPRYLGEGADARERAPRWRRAHDLFEETLGKGEGERLLAAGEVAALVSRAVAVERCVRPLQKEVGKASLDAGLSDPATARGYFAALFALLASPAPTRARFEAYAQAVAALPLGPGVEAHWPVATLLPFVAQPDRHMLLRPKITCEAALRLGFELAYDAAPRWETYAALLHSTAQLLEKLRPIGARDHVDVEAFLAAVAARRPPRPKANLRVVT